jgi:hypothetical protein
MSYSRLLLSTSPAVMCCWLMAYLPQKNLALVSGGKFFSIASLKHSIQTHQPCSLLFIYAAVQCAAVCLPNYHLGRAAAQRESPGFDQRMIKRTSELCDQPGWNPQTPLLNRSPSQAAARAVMPARYPSADRTVEEHLQRCAPAGRSDGLPQHGSWGARLARLGTCVLLNNTT